MDAPAPSPTPPPILDQLDPAVEQARIEASRANIEKVLAALERTRERLEGEKTDAEEELRDLTSRKRGTPKLEADVKGAEEKVRSREDEVEGLNGQIRALENIIDGLRKAEAGTGTGPKGEIEQANARLLELVQELVGTEEDARAFLEGKTIEPKTATGGVVKMLRDATLELAKAKREKTDADEKVLELEAEGQQETPDHTSVKVEQTAADGKVADLEAERGALGERRRTLEQRIGQLRGEIGDKTRELEARGGLLKQLEGDLKRLQDDRLKSAREAVSDANHEAGKVRELLTAATRRKAELEATVQRLTKEFEKLEAQRSKLEAFSDVLDRVLEAKTELPDASRGLRAFRDRLHEEEVGADELATAVFQRLSEVSGAVHHVLADYRHGYDVSLEELRTVSQRLNRQQDSLDEVLSAVAVQASPTEADIETLLRNGEALAALLEDPDVQRLSLSEVSASCAEALAEVNRVLEPLAELKRRALEQPPHEEEAAPSPQAIS